MRYNPEKVKDKIEKYKDSLAFSIVKYRSRYTTISGTASTRLVNNLLKLGIDSEEKVKQMTEEQMQAIRGYSQIKLLNLYREYLLSL